MPLGNLIIPMAKIDTSNIFQFNLGQYDGLQTITRFVAVGIILIWIGFTVMQYALPSKRGQRGMGRGGAGKIVGLVILLIILIDLSSIDLIIKGVVMAVAWVWNFVDEQMAGHVGL